MESDSQRRNNDNGALSFMEKLSPAVAIYRPTTASTSSDITSDPALIIVATWTDASSTHIAKYITKYQELYPKAQILLIRNTTKLFFNRSSIGLAVQPAVSVVRAAVAAVPASAAPRSSSHILLHIFSNGGSSSAGSLYEQCTATAAEGQDKQFPRHVTIFDSAPSTNFRMSKAVAFFTVGLSPIQRMIAAAGYTLVLWLRLTADIQTRWSNHHNRPDLVLEARRIYIYSDTDAIVHPDDIEQHAQEAEKAGYAVRREKFISSAHVSHSRKDADRYWEAVTSTWDGSYSEN
ncbi:unnamed protein product [Clonostachys rhizophaga]|uniref:Indole-diterpene biosynthesis protein PaxU n=1 Tax=Clonostachys rhizophaga TaxID=160324 RepID=A0A9N9VPM9_9HYPO|nr:unnamed protein product [Clonostachys rhizophaga]